MTATPAFVPPKRIVLEDTGERRHPKEAEIYVYLGMIEERIPTITPLGIEYRTRPPVPLDRRISVAGDDDEDDWADRPETFAIYRIVEVQL